MIKLQSLLIESTYHPLLIQLHFASNKSDYKKLVTTIQQKLGWDESDTEYMLKKLRKEVDYRRDGLYNDDYIEYGDFIDSKKYREFHAKYAPKSKSSKLISSKEYLKRVREMVKGHKNDSRSIIFDLAENLYRSDPEVVKYIIQTRKVKSKFDIIEEIVMDMERFTA